MHKRYDSKHYNCGHFVQDVLKNQFNLDVSMPCDVDGIRAQSKTIQESLDDIVIQSPRIFESAGILLENRKLYHIGIAVKINQKFYCLHNVKSFGGVMRHSLVELPQYELNIKGYYQWKQSQPIVQIQ